MQDHVFHLKSSRCFLIIQVLVFSATFVLLCSISLTWVVRFIFGCCLLIYAGYLFFQEGFFSQHLPITQLRCTTDNRWYIFDQKRWYGAILRGESTVTQFITILRFDVPTLKKRRSCCIFYDSLASDDYRALKVLLH